MSRSQSSFEPYPDPKNSPLVSQKFKKDPKNKSKSKVIFEGTIENKSCSTTWVDRKTVLSPTLTLKIANQGDKKAKVTPKLSQNKSRIEK